MNPPVLLLSSTEQLSVKFRFDESEVALNRLWRLSGVLSQLSFFSNGNYDRLAVRRRESIKAGLFLSASTVITFPTCISFSLSGCVYEKEEASGLNELEGTEIGYRDLAGSARCFTAAIKLYQHVLTACYRLSSVMVFPAIEALGFWLCKQYYHHRRLIV